MKGRGRLRIFTKMTLFKRFLILLSLTVLVKEDIKALSAPLLLTHLDAYLCQSGVNLKWSFPKEKAQGLFVLERSYNGKDFEVISRIENSHAEENSGEFLETDFDPSPGMRYYRLKTVDTEGQERVSETVAILKKSGEAGLYESVVLHQEESKWKTEELSGEEALVVLQDSEGNERYSKFRFMSENDQSFAADLLHEIPPGLYTVSACSKQRYYSARLLVK